MALCPAHPFASFSAGKRVTEHKVSSNSVTYFVYTLGSGTFSRTVAADTLDLQCRQTPLAATGLPTCPARLVERARAAANQ